MVEDILAAAESAGEPLTTTPASAGDEAAEQSTKQDRGRSTIQFPYNDLDDAVSVAKAIYNNAGQQCDADQLAAYMRHGSIASGAFRLKVAAARTFGLIETEGQRVSLTALGQRVVDPQQEAHARVDAFLGVPLYRRIFELYKGRPLPRDIALENEMVNLGVVPKQKDKARQVFQRSADQAGFFAYGRDRLVAPGGSANAAPADIANHAMPPPAENFRSSVPSGGGAGGGQPPGLHPFIQGLLQTLPSTGTVWPQEKRAEWLQAAETVFKLIYRDSESRS